MLTALLLLNTVSPISLCLLTFSIMYTIINYNNNNMSCACTLQTGHNNTVSDIVVKLEFSDMLGSLWINSTHVHNFTKV